MPRKLTAHSLSAVMTLLRSCTLAEASCVDSNLGDTIRLRLRLRGTDQARPIHQPLQPSTRVSILQALLLGRIRAPIHRRLTV